jgi:protein TonB
MVARTVERRPLGALGRMSIVAAMHLAVAFLIARSLGLVPMTMEPKTEAVFIDEPQRPELPPPPDEYVVPRSDAPELPAPELPPIDDTPNDPITAELVDPGTIPNTASGSADPQPVLVGVRQDPRRPLSQPPYPSFDIRGGHEGSADVEVYVLPSGRVSEARIVKSTGFERMDQATIEEAKRNWRLIPATRDGEPIAQWYRLRVVFKLKNQ